MIPKTLHFIWLQGFDALPDDRRVFMAAWEEHAKRYGLTIKTWDDASITALIEKNVERYGPQLLPRYRASPTFAQKSDIGRLVILDTEGGIYMDVDIMPLRQFDHLFTADVRLAYTRRNFRPLARHFVGGYNNHMIAAVAGHPILRELLQFFAADDPADGTPYAVTLRGFGQFMKLFEKYENDPGTAAVSSDLLDPINVLSAHRCSECTTAEQFRQEFPSALIIHVSGLHKTIQSGEEWFDKRMARLIVKSYSEISDNSMLLLGITTTLLVALSVFTAVSLSRRK